MKRRELLPILLLIAFSVVLPSCGVGTGTSASGTLGPAPSLSVTPAQTVSVAVNGVANYTATTNSTTPVLWSIGGNALVNTGTLSFPNGNNTVQYTAPSTPPIYPAGVATSTQGTVTLEAVAYNATITPAIYSETFAITAPTIIAGISPALASVALGGNATFTVYAVGNVNNAVTLQVNGITGGNLIVGTISLSGVYQAPTTMPMSGSSITITCTSQADPTKSGTAVVTLH